MKRDKGGLLLAALVIIMICVSSLVLGCSGAVKKETGDDRDVKSGTEEVSALPEGTFVAFRRNNQVWTARGEGSEQKQLTDGYDSFPAVSPDGKTIVFQHSEGDPAENEWNLDDPEQPGPSVGIFAMPSEGGPSRLLTPPSWLTGTGWEPLYPITEHTLWVKRNCKQPSFSLDGKRICFIIRETYYVVGEQGFKGRGYCHGLAIVSADGNGEPTIIFRSEASEHPGAGALHNPRFSSDGMSIYVVNRTTANASEIDTIPAAGGSLSRITPATNSHTREQAPDRDEADQTEIEYIYFALSPNGEQLALVENDQKRQPPEFRITMMKLNDESTRLVYDSYDPNEKDKKGPYVGSGPPSFAPSGRELIFFNRLDYPRAEFKPNIYIISTEGGKPRKVISNGDLPCFGKLE